ncbi:hypothetical protein DFH07DRAFT_862496 [Mycena maculata]|uniref:Uncharacterized protein n=1 Tax=Mycena maculata TaxID=230809 RepID=A0AAD7HB97_9AGAR|nr:hypothetical protein DFH07DRAFT_862496 [Mycena maculata]
MATFSQTSPISDSEKDWAANLGMLDWDTTQIVFTKRTLMEFLKYTGTTVDTNFANIQKLPRYAKFGKITDGAPAAETVGPASATASATPSPSADFKPTRRVRELPGGPRANIFADEEVSDALSMAPPKGTTISATISPAAAATPVTAAAVPEAEAPAAAEDEEKDQGNDSLGTGIKPSRRVREAQGGNSSLNSFWGADEPEEFKPTRRVRAPPGGSVSGIF